jgi:hypothetical protein
MNKAHKALVHRKHTKGNTGAEKYLIHLLLIGNIGGTNEEKLQTAVSFQEIFNSNFVTHQANKIIWDEMRY